MSDQEPSTTPPAADPTGDNTTRTSIPPDAARLSLGAYKLLQCIGEGGMGEVWRAEQTAPVHREVAVKLIKHGMDSKQVIARFEAERQALALMNHPAIALVFDAGSAPDGRPYFVMEYIKGEPLTTYCDRHKLSIEQRLDLFVQVCEGVQHAHQKGIIHRDLKPSNVLVTLLDGRAVPKIIDFGVAKATARPLTERTLFTELGVLIGTPEYMSPEQADLTELDVDTRTDVYALGVMLYELLTGQLPFSPQTLRQAGFDEIRRLLREVDPPRPSTKVSTLGAGSTVSATNRRTEPGALHRALKGDLDWITMKALEKDRARRYGSPADLAADVVRHNSDQPVLARPPAALYRVGKFVARHRRGLAALASGLLVVTAAGTVAWNAQRGLRVERERAALFRQHEDVRALLASLQDPDSLLENERSFRPIVDALCQRIRNNRSDSLDAEAFVRLFFEFSVSGRPLVRASDDSAIFYSLTTHGRWADLGAGLGILVRPTLRLDGVLLSGTRCGDQCLFPITGRFSGSTVTNVNSTFTHGRHRLDGSTRYEVVRLRDAAAPRTQFVNPQEVPYDVLADAVGQVETAPLHFTAVAELPSDYPPRIAEDAEVERIKSGMRLENVVLQEKNSVPTALTFNVLFPMPRMALACSVRVSAEGSTVEEKMGLTVGREVAWSSLSGRPDAARVSMSQNENGVWVVSISLPLDKKGRWIDHGADLHLRFAADRDLALRAPDITEFLDFSHELTAKVTQVQNLPEP